MEKIRKGGNCLRTLVKMALPHFKQAERLKQRTGRGDKPHNPEWFVAVLIMIAVLQKKKRKSAQYRYLAEHRLEIAEWTSVKAFPSRATYFRRYRRAHQLYRTAIRLQGQQAIAALRWIGFGPFLEQPKLQGSRLCNDVVYSVSCLRL